MPTPEKEKIVAEIKEHISNNEVAIITQYVGMNVAQATELRKQLRGADALFKVYKNTLASRALHELNLDAAVGLMEGPTSWAFCKDPVAPAKILKEYAKEVPFVVMRGGILNGTVVTAGQLERLADLPPAEQLLAQVVGTLAMPMRNMLGVLTAVPRNLVNALDQIRKQKEEAEAA
ncbi:MAG: 50S ribosomal protein L10 [Candidatus Hydrogenedentes bacterium ADurb.Bin179]|nr:MAG: 50S ribosomal protein L10 [Candidatus Hydrogenedentes bacterium ADurb.Bin179]